MVYICWMVYIYIYILLSGDKNKYLNANSETNDWMIIPLFPSFMSISNQSWKRGFGKYRRLSCLINRILGMKVYCANITRLMMEVDRKLTMAPLAAAIQSILLNHKPSFLLIMLTHLVDFSSERKQENPEKTHGYRQSWRTLPTCDQIFEACSYMFVAGF